MDPRLQYYLKFIEQAPLNPSSIDAKDLNWEGYNYSRQFKLPAEIVDHLDANKIPLHYQANVDTILKQNFGTTDVDEILHKIKLKKDWKSQTPSYFTYLSQTEYYLKFSPVHYFCFVY